MPTGITARVIKSRLISESGIVQEGRSRDLGGILTAGFAVGIRRHVVCLVLKSHFEAHLLLLELIPWSVPNFLRIQLGLIHHGRRQMVEISGFRVTLDFGFRAVVLVSATHLRNGRLAEGLIIFLTANYPASSSISNRYAKRAKNIVALL